MFFVFLNIDQQDELREHGESNFKTLASLRPHYTIGKVYAYVPTLESRINEQVIY